MKSRITRVSAKNLKGRNFVHALAPLTLIHGRNGSGKSAILDAITLAASGRHPDLPQTNAGVFQLASASPLTVELSVGVGDVMDQAFIRTWTKGKGVTVSGKSTVPEGLQFDPLIFSPDKFFSASAKDRAALIRARVGGDENAMVESIVAAMREHPVALKVKPKMGKDFDEWLDEWTEALGNQATELAGFIKRQRATLQTMTALDEGSVELVTLDDIEAAGRAAADAEREERQTAESTARFVEALRKNLQAYKLHLGAKDLLEAGSEDQHAREALRVHNMNYEALDRAWSLYNAAASGLDFARQNLTRRVGVEIGPDTFTKALAALEEEMATAKREMEALPPFTTDQFRGYHAEAMDLGVRIDRSQQAIAAAQKSLAEGSTCATCGSAVDHWGADKLADLRNIVETGPDALAGLEHKLATLKANKASYDKLVEEHGRLFEIIRHCEKQHKDTLALQAEWSALEAKTKELPPKPEQDLQELAEEGSTLEREAEDAAEALESAKQRQANLEALNLGLGANVGPWPLDRIAAEIETRAAVPAPTSPQLRERVQELRSKYEAGEASRASAANLLKVEKDLAEAEEEEKTVAPAKKALEAAAKDATSKLLGPVLEAADYFTQGLIPGKITNRGLDIGRWDGVTWIPLATFSMSERMICAAGIIAAMAEQSAAKLVILDECNRIDEDRRAFFVGRIHQAIQEGRLAQAILVSNTAWNATAAADVLVIRTDKRGDT